MDNTRMVNALRRVLNGKRTPPANYFDGSYVHVLQPIGEVYHARCTADMFTPGVLTITSLDEPDAVPVVREYQPGTWREVTVFEHGDPAFAFYAEKESK